MTLSLKPGVRMAGLRPETVLGIQIASDVYAARGHDCVVTSLCEGRHGRGSLHFQGAAFDLRIRDIPPDRLEDLDAALARALGSDFDVVLEPDHFHIEYQPKCGVNQ